jgi:Na+-driven multidrug efflux pump
MSAKVAQHESMGKFSSYREILRVAIPISFESLLQASFNFIGQIIVGVLGATAVAAVGLSNSGPKARATKTPLPVPIGE